MALWNGLGQVATVAQLAGVDAGGLITMILEAVQTVRQNKEECRQLARRVMMISDLLQKLQGWDMMQDPEIRGPLDGLDTSLREAYVLIASCQGSSITYRYFMGWKQASRLREVQKRIDCYIQLYPFISHIDITRRIEQICNVGQPQSLEQAADTVLGSFSSHANPDGRNQRSGNGTENNGLERVQAGMVPFEVKIHLRAGLSVFRFSELAAATNDFSHGNIIGSGGFGHVYKGQMHDGRQLAIKRCSRSGSDPDILLGLRAFETEIRVIMLLQHRNIVRLLGFCTKRGERILVYEYIQNGSLDKFISGSRTDKSLEWSSCFRIVKGIAHGVLYLHKLSGLPLVHGDLKPSNILLDSEMNPKIADFGLARLLRPGTHEVCTEMVLGTIGYLDIDYINTGRYSVKSDVYAFGIILLELISGKPSMLLSQEPRHHRSLGDFARDLWAAGRSDELIDPSLRATEDQMNKIKRCTQIALLCVEPSRKDRPSIWDVVLMLSSESIIVPAPMQQREVGAVQHGEASSSHSLAKT